MFLPFGIGLVVANVARRVIPPAMQSYRFKCAEHRHLKQAPRSEHTRIKAHMAVNREFYIEEQDILELEELKSDVSKLVPRPTPEGFKFVVFLIVMVALAGLLAYFKGGPG